MCQYMIKIRYLNTVNLFKKKRGGQLNAKRVAAEKVWCLLIASASS